ncbi:hypothetical protein ANO11243_085990 [Dothideomycetidae sp. 11243]|nr:hypothetical protein ANO11243_085990 [fungal sp. No.11243]
MSQEHQQQQQQRQQEAGSPPAPKPLRPVNLTLTPVSMLTSIHGNSLPDPFAPTPTTPSPMARPPTPGGGPLSSHPATPVNLTDRYTPPPFPAVDHQTRPQVPEKVDSAMADSPFDYPISNPVDITPSKSTPPKCISLEDAAAAYAAAGSAPSLSTSRPSSSHLNNAFTPIKTSIPARKPLTPASGNNQKPLSRSNSTGVKKLLSLSSLRSSFSTSSRSSSLALQRTATTNDLQSTNNSPATSTSSAGKRRGSSPSLSQTLSPTSADTYATYSASVVAPGRSPVPDATISPTAQRVRKRKSGSWFRRASFLINLDGESKKASRADSFVENKTPQYTLSNTGSPGKRSIQMIPREDVHARAPMLPELQGLGVEHKERWSETIFAGMDR